IHRARDELERLMAAGVALTIGMQAVMNLMVVTGLAPTKGIALPFVSAGGTGLLITAAAAGVLINVGRSQTMPLLCPKKGEDSVNDEVEQTLLHLK
ncbi:MAG: FtsW/RodA/SpoVE family cell cycle protein, partial [Sedimentisphaerales bacterium]|nr:FtsW/RodA/SpoVE family cell cycle protein [Sedimentisphaerales bacterium]